MNPLKKRLPEGVQDFAPAECARKRTLEQTLRETFDMHGFLEVETPSFEFFDVFSKGVGAYTQEQLIKFFDLKGRILVLRPDMTVPIARMAADTGGRFFYVQKAFAVGDYNIGQRGEYTQAGVEYLGGSGSGADAEVMALAIETLKRTGIEGFKLDIGQIAFFKGILKEAGITDQHTIEQLRSLIDMKNTVELEYLLEALPVDDKCKLRLLALPGLFGGEDMIERARTLSNSSYCIEALDNISKIIDSLKALGLQEYITLDLGLLHGLGYYSGVVFRGMTQEMGFPLLSGGRYDKLCGDFGANMPAIGFALGIERTLLALERQGRINEKLPSRAAVLAELGEEYAAQAKAKSLRDSGIRTVLKLDATAEDKTLYKNEFDSIYMFDKDGKLIQRGDA